MARGVSTEKNQALPRPAPGNATSRARLPELRERDRPHAEHAHWRTGVESLELTFEIFEPWMFLDESREKLLDVFGALKTHQSSIEGLLHDYAQRRDYSSPALAKRLHQWTSELSTAIVNGTLSLNDFDLQQLQRMALGWTACISLGQPNLFKRQDSDSAGPATSSKAAIEALKLVSKAMFERFLSIKEEAAQEYPGYALNVHNLVTRLNKAKLFDTTDSMREASARCFSLMKRWSKTPASGLDKLAPDVEKGKLEAEIAKRAGKAIVQVESFCDPDPKLLSLDKENNRKTLVQVLNWLGHKDSIDLYCRNGADGIVALSSLAHLYSKLLDWGYLPADQISGAKLTALLEGMDKVLLQCKGQAQIRSLANFGGLLGDVLKPGREAFWEGGTEPSLERACTGFLDTLAEIPTTKLDIRSSVQLFAGLHAMEGWLARRAASSTTAITTTTTSATTTTTSTSSSAVSGSSASADSGKHLVAIRDKLGLAVARLLSSLNVNAIEAEKAPDHIAALLDLLCWLSRSPELAGTVQPLLDALLTQIQQRQIAWRSNQASVAGNLHQLIEGGHVHGSESLFNAVLGKPQAGAMHALQDLKRAAKGFRPPGLGEPLAFNLTPETPSDVPTKDISNDVDRGGQAGKAPVFKSVKAPSYRRRVAKTSAASTILSVTETAVPFRKVSTGAKPAVRAPSQEPVAVVVIDEEEKARIAEENRDAELKRKQAEQAIPRTASRRSPRQEQVKPGPAAAGGKRNAQAAKAHAGQAKEKETEEFDRLLQEAQWKAPVIRRLPGWDDPGLLQSNEYEGMEKLPASLAAELRAIKPLAAKDPRNSRVSTVVKELEALALKNNASAKFHLSLLYQTGKFDTKFKKKQARAKVLLEEASVARLPAAWFQRALDKMKTDSENIGTGIAYLSKAANLDHAKACLLFGRYFETENTGKNTEKRLENLKIAFKYWKTGAGKNDADSQLEVALCYRDGKGTDQNPEQARTYLKLAAENGSRKADQLLQEMPPELTSGVGTPASRPTVKLPVDWDIRALKSAVEEEGLEHLGPLGDQLRAFKSGRLPKEAQELVLNALRARTESGEAWAKFHLSLLLQNEKFVEQGIAKGKLMLIELKDQLPAAHFKMALNSREQSEDDIGMAMASMTFAADGGHPKACYLIGVESATGVRRPRDMAKAIAYWKVAADKQEPNAQLQLGLCHADGKGVLKSMDEAERYISLSAKGGSIRARHVLELLKVMTAKTGAQTNAGQASLASRAENPMLDHHLDELPLSLVFQLMDAKQGFLSAAQEQLLMDSLEDLSQQRNRAALFQLGLLKLGKADQYIEAVQHIRQAAELNLPSAVRMLEEVAAKAGAGKDQSQFPPLPAELAACVDAMAEGSLDPKTTEETLEALRLLADKGHAHARLRLSNLLWSGEVGLPDPKRAMVYLKDAANQGLADAQYALGEILGHRRGTEANSESERLLRLADAGGHLEAGPSLANMLWADAGKLTDNMKAAELKAEAVKLWRQAAGKGHVDSKFQLRRCYQQGEGIARDMLEGQRWIEEAARNGHEKAKSVLASRQAREAKPAAKPASTQTSATKATPVAPVPNQTDSTPLNEGLGGLSQLASLARQGNPAAMYRLGLLLREGSDELPKDILRSNALIGAAANLGLKAAKRELKAMAMDQRAAADS